MRCKKTQEKLDAYLVGELTATVEQFHWDSGDLQSCALTAQKSGYSTVCSANFRET